MIQIFLAGRTNQPMVVQEVLADLKMFRSVGLKMEVKQSVTFAFFSKFLNPQRDTLTYSGIGQMKVYLFQLPSVTLIFSPAQ